MYNEHIAKKIKELIENLYNVRGEIEKLTPKERVLVNDLEELKIRYPTTYRLQREGFYKDEIPEIYDEIDSKKIEKMVDPPEL